MRFTIKQMFVIVAVAALVTAGATYGASSGRTIRVVHVRKGDVAWMDSWNAGCVIYATSVQCSKSKGAYGVYLSPHVADVYSTKTGKQIFVKRY